MAEVSHRSPYRHFVLITDDWERRQGEIDEWQLLYGDDPVVALAFARQFAKVGETEKAVDYYRRHLSQVDNTDAAIALAGLYYAQDNDQWRATFEGALEFEDYGSDHARVNRHLAENLMQEGRYEEALPYALAAVESGEEEALIGLALCYEGLGRHEDADAAVQADEDQYSEGRQYLWRVRTGRGDLEQAILGYKRAYLSWYPPQHERNARVEFRDLIYTGRKQAALEFALRELDRLTTPVDRLAVAMLAEEQGNNGLTHNIIAEMAAEERKSSIADDQPQPGQLLEELMEMRYPDRQHVEALFSQYHVSDSDRVDLVIGWHLTNRDQTELAAEYLRRLAGSRRWENPEVLIAQLKLRELDIALADIPHQYPYGFDKNR